MSGGADIPPLSDSGAEPFDERGVVAALLSRGILDPPSRPGLAACIDRFEVLRAIGAGGMCIVLEARDPAKGERVAVKLLRQELMGQASAVRHFLREARFMRDLQHPHIADVREVSDRAERPYFVMPFMRRGSLASLLREDETLEPATVVPIVRGIAEALGYAHNCGVIHGDLKPANVLIDDEGEAYLADFGLLRKFQGDSLLDVQNPHVEGTAPYLSPAVAAGKAEDSRRDIYAFGALLYEILTRRPPYDGQSAEEILAKIRAGPPVSIATVNPSAPKGLRLIAKGAMARRLRDRYAEMSDVVRDLERVEQGSLPLGPRGGTPARLAAFLLRHWRAAVATVALLALAGLCIWLALRAGVLRLEQSAERPAPTTVPTAIRTGDGWQITAIAATPADEDHPIWSPDGEYLAFVSAEGGRRCLWFAPREGRAKRIPANDPADIGTPVWTPDSQGILYSQSGARPTNLVLLTFPPSRGWLSYKFKITDEKSPYVAWGADQQVSPQGNRIVSSRARDGWPQVYVVYFDDREPEQIGQPPFSGHCTWNPDGNHVAYKHNERPGSPSDIWVVEPGGQNDREVIGREQIGQHVHALAWSLDGQSLIFSNGFNDPLSGVGMVTLNGNLRWLVEEGGTIAHQAYSWQADVCSPDGQSLVCSIRESNNWDVYVVELSTGSKQLVASTPGDDVLARFSRDGSICFQTDAGGNWDIYTAARTDLP